MSMLTPNVEELVHAEHRYRKLLALLTWTDLAKPLRKLYSGLGRRGYAVEQGLKCLFLQFLEDRSDRQRGLSKNEALASFLGVCLARLSTSR